MEWPRLQDTVPTLTTDWRGTLAECPVTGGIFAGLDATNPSMNEIEQQFATTPTSKQLDIMKLQFGLQDIVDANQPL